MSIIKIQPEALRGKAKELRGLRGEHEAVMKRITSLMNGLGAEWSGEAQNAFQQSFQGMAPTFQKFVEILDGYANLMDDAAQKMTDADQDAKNAIERYQ